MWSYSVEVRTEKAPGTASDCPFRAYEYALYFTPRRLRPDQFRLPVTPLYEPLMSVQCPIGGTGCGKWRCTVNKRIPN